MALPRASRAITSSEFSKWLIGIDKHHRTAVAAHHSQDRHDLAHARQWGIALSGGVDSMALATLLSRHVRSASDASIQIHAMIVNHNLRDNSREEAEYVASLVQPLGIKPHVLHLDWSRGKEASERLVKPDKAHLETQARIKRYDAVARQCAELSIHHLFFGHHAGDQAETVLFRLARASGIDGLAGIQSTSPMGVIHTAQAKSIQVIRPLLFATKGRLEATCREAGTRWVEDPTNKTLDYQRNIIRHYQKCVDRLAEQQPLLAPLTTPSLLAFRERMNRHRRVVHAQVSPWLSRIEFDKNNGLCFFQLRQKGVDSAETTPVPWLLPSQDHIGTRLLGQLVRWVTCKDHVPRSEDIQELLYKLQQAEQIMPSPSGVSTATQRQSELLTCPSDDGESTVYRRLKPRHRKRTPTQNLDGRELGSLNYAGALFSPPHSSKDKAPYWTLSRQPYSAAEQLAAKADVPLDSRSAQESADFLWNHRFFVQVWQRNASEDSDSPQIRLLQPTDVNALRSNRKQGNSAHPDDDLDVSNVARLNAYLSKVPNKARYLIPVVVDKNQQSIISIPSLGIHLRSNRYVVQSQFRHNPPM